VLASGRGAKALGGYSGAGGPATKRQLLELEGALPAGLFAAESPPRNG